MFALKGKMQDPVDDGQVHWIAAAPATQGVSFSGSGLPFANKAQAFENTPNKGTVKVDKQGHFTIHMFHPNAFYENLGTTLVPPTVFLSFLSGGQWKTTEMQVSEPIPFRSLTYPDLRKRAHVMFYDNVYRLPVRTQEKILLSAAYPEKDIEPDNFWGLKPSV